MIAPRLLRPFVRTRTRLTLTVGLSLAALVAAPLPWLVGSGEPREKAEAAPAPITLRDEATARVEARRTGKEVLVETATSATSLTWARPDGQLRSTIHAAPQRAKDDDGQWQDLDNTLTRTEETPGGLDIRPVHPPTPVRFSAGSTTQEAGPAESVLAEVEIEGHTLTYTWPGPLPEPVLDGPRALYPEVRSGVDLLIVAREDGGFAQLLIVKNPAPATIDAVSTVSYGLRSETLVFRRDATTGGVQALDPASKREVAAIPTPFAWDSAGLDPDAEPGTAPRTATATSADVLRLSGLSGIEPGAAQAPIPTRLDGDGGNEVRLHLDAAASGLLTGKEVRYPIFLDPTLNSGATGWTFAYKPRPDSNYWNGTNFNGGTSDARVGHETDTGGTARSFWRMGFSSSLRGATVSEASFKVLNNYSWSCNARAIQLWLTGPISTGTTWRKQPDWMDRQETKSFAHGRSGCAADYVSYNVKAAAQDGADNGWSSLTLGMRASSETDEHAWRKFRANSAELSVTFNRPPNEPVNGTTTPGGACVTSPAGGVTVAKTNIVLAATATDPDNNLERLLFRFWATNTSPPATGTPVTPNSSGRGSRTIPSSTLVDGMTYAWDVTALDEADATSSSFPPGNNPCLLTVDASAPPAPEVTSEVFKEATDDGATWATVKFGQTGPITFAAESATRFSYSFDGVGSVDVPAPSGTATVPDLRPRHAGPTTLQVYAYDAAGNRSERTDYTFYVPPRDTADGPGDTGGDAIPDLLVVDDAGLLRNYAGDVNGELHAWQTASYTSEGTLNPPGHWYNPGAGTAALITKHSDVYPGDGSTDLFARIPDGTFWLYPGDGYGSFDVRRRIVVLLPANAPDPATWTQVKAIGDITGDKLPDLVLRAGTAFWTLSGYTGGSFQEATLMEGTAWARQEIVNVADVDLDNTPDLLWRNLDTGAMYVRHGRPGAVTGSVDLNSLKTAAASRNGDVSYGTSWTETNVSAVIGIPDVNGDGVPDIWARFGTDGQIRIYHPSTTNTNAPVKVVIGEDWRSFKAFG